MLTQMNRRGKPGLEGRSRSGRVGRRAKKGPMGTGR